MAQMETNLANQSQLTPQTQQVDVESPVVSPKTVSKPMSHHDLSPMGMYRAADWVVKAVMISLLIASVVTWGIGLTKQFQLSRATRRAKRLLVTLLDAKDFSEGQDKSLQFPSGGLALVKAVEQELNFSDIHQTDSDGIKERVQLRLERVQAQLGRSMNSGTGFLATIGSVGPFVGLFGTVWGIMNAFIGIAKSQNTTLAVVAPGIAEALLATAIGLVAAIPAVIIYNHFSRATAKYRALLMDISSALLVLVSRDLGSSKQPIEKVG